MDNLNRTNAAANQRTIIAVSSEGGAQVRSSAPSIPSKYEHPIPKHDRERKAGFGSSTLRFSDSEREGGGIEGGVPGPGRYYRETSYLRDAKKCGSVSAQGYTAMVSRAPRFSDLEELEQKILPGPGSYEPRHHLTTPAAPRINFSVERINLHRPGHPKGGGGSRGAPAKKETPGPGHYMVERTDGNASHNQGSSSFKSTARGKGGDDAGNDSGPAVGCYDVGRCVDYMHKLGKDERRGVPFPDPIFSSTSDRIAGPPGGDGADLPGPGEYEHEDPLGDPSRYYQQSAVFDTSLDRFGRSTLQAHGSNGNGGYHGGGRASPTEGGWAAADEHSRVDHPAPGPGEYCPEEVHAPIHNGAASIFWSSSNRFECINAEQANPGPGECWIIKCRSHTLTDFSTPETYASLLLSVPTTADYCPKSVKQKFFFRNIYQKWV